VDSISSVDPVAEEIVELQRLRKKKQKKKALSPKMIDKYRTSQK
jgi:hypothetical protein